MSQNSFLPWRLVGGNEVNGGGSKSVLRISAFEQNVTFSYLQVHLDFYLRRYYERSRDLQMLSSLLYLHVIF